MIAGADEVEAKLDAWIEKWGLPEELKSMLLRQLRPAIGFEPGGEAELGGTRFGGTPDLPPGTDWPVRPALPDAGDVAERGGSRHDLHIRRYADMDLPYMFFGQVDLASLTGAQPDTPLPREGRLLFFYDYTIGPWDTAPRMAAVIHDASDAAALVPAERPQAFAAMEVRDRADALSDPNPYGLAREELLDGLMAYVFDARSQRPVVLWQLPHPQAFEHDEAVTRRIEELDDEYETESAYDELQDDWNERGPLMLSVPRPEQSDPRYDAVFADDADLTARWEASETVEELVPEVAAKAADHVVLLEAPIAFVTGDGEGTVTFVIRRDALAARDFSAVLPVYQQT